MHPPKHTNSGSLLMKQDQYTNIDTCTTTLIMFYQEETGGYLNPVYSEEGNLVLILFTAQLGSTTLTRLPSQPQHQFVNCR